jgi:hypothetical protein
MYALKVPEDGIEKISQCHGDDFVWFAIKIL